MARYSVKNKMPSSHHKDDREFIDGQLMKLNEQHKLIARMKYSEIYAETLNLEPIGHKKSNKARHEANARLLGFVSACIKRYTPKAPAIHPVENNFKGF